VAESIVLGPCLTESLEHPEEDPWDFYPRRDREPTEEGFESSQRMTNPSLAILQPLWDTRLE